MYEGDLFSEGNWMIKSLEEEASMVSLQRREERRTSVYCPIVSMK
jgi:hypothetical protein